MKSKKIATAKISTKPPVTTATSLLSGNWLIGFSLLLSFLAYIPVFSAEFVNWDDQDYVMNNQLIRSFSDFGKFFTTPVQGNYHPLTMISLAVNFAFSGDNASSYHILNLLLHLVNVFLVFKLISKLTQQNLIIAFSTALLFGVHPMHVESVAWVSERKDVLYTVFFLLGFIQYIQYIETSERKHFIYTFLFFLLSIASKPAAIIFPLVLFAFDYFKKRNFNAKLILEKIPFFVVAALIVFLTLKGQATAGATDSYSQFGIDKRIFFPFYGSMMYILKLIWPLNLSPFYPFPPINESLSNSYLFSPLLFLLIVGTCLITWKKNREITFGFSFYYINLLLVLQFFIVGSAIIADRYTYVPYIGLFFILAWLVDHYFQFKKNNSIVLFFAIGTILTFLSYQQAGIWKNTGTLWEGAIQSNPGARAYANRAYIHQQAGEFEKAHEYYDKSLKYNVIDPEVYTNKAVMYFDRNQDSLALMNFNKALDLRSNFVNALNGRGSLYARQGKNELALADFTKSIEQKPNYELPYKNRAAAHFVMNNFDLAIRDYKKYIELNPKDYESYSNLAVVYLNKSMNNEAIDAASQSIKMNPKFAKGYSNLGAAYINLKDYNKAILYLDQAWALDTTNEETLKFLSLAYLNKGETAKAMSFFEIAQRLKK